MPIEFTLLGIPLDTGNPLQEPNTFAVEIVARLSFAPGDVSPDVVAQAIAAHPLLSGDPDKSIIAYALGLQAWEQGGRRFDQADAIPLTLRHVGAKPLATLADTLRRYLLPPSTVHAAEMVHDGRFSSLNADHFVDMGKAHDELQQLTQLMHASALSRIGTMSLVSDRDRSRLSMEAIRWVDSAAHATLLDGLRGKSEEAAGVMGRLQAAERIGSLRDAVGKINRRMAINAVRKTADAEARAFRTTGQNPATAQEQTTLANPNDPNVATHAALKNPLLARECGFVTSWRATAARPVRGDFVFYIPPTSPLVSCKPTAFRRRDYTHPLAFADIGRQTTTNAALAFLNDDAGRERYRASSVHSESELVKQVVVQASNSIATPTAADDDRFGDFTGSRDERPPQLLGDEQFGSNEPETSGVTFSAPVDDLVTPQALRGTPEERERAYPCLFLEDLWVGFRLDLRLDRRTPFLSAHEHTEQISFALSNTTIAGPTEDYFEREQADDPERGYSSTEFALYAGMTTAQARDYLQFIGNEPPPVVPLPAPFTSEVVGYEASVPLLFGNVYRYRLRNVMIGGIGLSPKQADLVMTKSNYEQRFPFFRARAYRPGEIVTWKAGEDSETNGDGRAIFLTDERPEARITLAPVPIDADTARFHGLLLGDPNEPRRDRNRVFVSDLGKFFVGSGGRMDYYFDPDVRGVFVRVRMLNGAPEPEEGLLLNEDGAYCQVMKHLVLEPVELVFGTGSWESFKPITLEFRTTSAKRPSVRGVPGRLEILIPAAAHVDVSLVPSVTAGALVKTASYASSGTQLARNPRLDAASAFRDWLPVAAMAEHRIQVIHAIRRPLFAPRLIGAPIAIRPRGKEMAEVRGRVEVDAASTGQIKLDASWTDIDDDPSQPRYLLTPGSSTTTPRNVVFNRFRSTRASSRAYLSSLVGSVTAGGSPAAPLTVAVGRARYPFVDQFGLQCAENKVFLGPPEGEETSGEPATHPEILSFSDARRKLATLKATAIGRFAQVFSAQDAAGLQNASELLSVDVPASLRMSPPDVSHVLPLTRMDTARTGADRIHRSTYAMRIYVRPRWFESGPGERLAIGCIVGDAPTGPIASVDKRITQWGEDPIERPRLDSTMRLPRASDFFPPEGAQAPALDTVLYPPDGRDGRDDVMYRDGLSQRLSVASFALREDTQHRLWYCDVQVAGDFIGWCGLALYRHQPHAHEGTELSEASDWVYAAVLQGDVVAVVEREGNLRVTIGPVYDPDTTFEFEALEYQDGVSENLVAVTEKPRALQRYQVNEATYFEGIVSAATAHPGLVKKRFGHRVGGLELVQPR